MFLLGANDADFSLFGSFDFSCPLELLFILIMSGWIENGCRAGRGGAGRTGLAPLCCQFSVYGSLKDLVHSKKSFKV